MRLNADWIYHILAHPDKCRQFDTVTVYYYSHSTVAGGFEVISWQTRFTPRTLLHIFATTSTRNFWSKKYLENNNNNKSLEIINLVCFPNHKRWNIRYNATIFFVHAKLIKYCKRNKMISLFNHLKVNIQVRWRA